MNSYRKFKIVLVESDDVTIETKTLSELVDIKSDGSEPEWRYSIDEILDSIMDLRKYEKMTFQWNRDNPETIGVIVRIN